MQIKGSEQKELPIREEYSGSPEWLRVFTQPFIRWLLLNLANYEVEIEGEIPTKPSLMLAYPHGEHANSILLPPRNITYVAARDTFFKSRLQQFALSLLLNAVPISRDEDFSRQVFAREIEAMRAAVNDKHHSLLIYPQGTRKGPVASVEQLQGELKAGIHLIAKNLALPVVPIGIVYESGYSPRKGGVDVWKIARQSFRDGRLPPKRSVQVKIGEPFEAEELARKVFMQHLAAELYQLVHGSEDDKARAQDFEDTGWLKTR